MATLRIDFQFQPFPPAFGYQVGYRVKGSTDPFTMVLPNPSSPPIIITDLPEATNFEGYIISECGYGQSASIPFETDVCFCPEDFTASPDGSYCYKVETTLPTIMSSNVCFATVTNGGNYSYYGTRIYAPGLSLPDIAEAISLPVASLPPGTLQGVMSNAYWASLGVASQGPMNRAGVWLDTDCNGVVDGLTAGSQATIAWSYNNPGSAKQVFIGVGADNQFILQVNGVTVAQTSQSNATENFRYWHLIPATFVNGSNIVNVIATGDGSTNDCVAFIVYDNNANELLNATQDADLNILFSTATLRGTQWNIATCPAGFDLDTSGGVSNYICRKTETVACG